MGAADREKELWRLLVTEGLTYDGNANSRLPFSGMSKKYGKAWIDYLKAAWFAKDELSEAEFSRLNGDVPATFIAKNL